MHRTMLSTVLWKIYRVLIQKVSIKYDTLSKVLPISRMKLKARGLIGKDHWAKPPNSLNMHWRFRVSAADGSPTDFSLDLLSCGVNKFSGGVGVGRVLHYSVLATWFVNRMKTRCWGYGRKARRGHRIRRVDQCWQEVGHVLRCRILHLLDTNTSVAA